jgi:serine/threonine protein kinase
MFMDKKDIMGEGSSSICRRGKNIETGEELAIKIYKSAKTTGTTLLKFRRQIEVLLELLKPFEGEKVKQQHPKLWHSRLDNVDPKDIFMSVVDYSKDEKGVPNVDQGDGQLYVITELAQYSMKDYLAQRREQKHQFSPNAIRNCTDSIILVMAGLHAKGLVHIDFKPENVMMFNGRLKLIDVDGCVKMNTTVQITDSSISFSPCYCAPEWAKFLIDESNSSIVVSPMLDVWSVGMTIAEFVTLDAVLKPQYASFLRNDNRSHQEAGFLFMEWLSQRKKSPIIGKLKDADKDFQELVNEWLCVPKVTERRTCAEALSCTYLEKTAAGGADSTDLNKLIAPVNIERVARTRLEDDSDPAQAHAMSLWKLNTGCDPNDEKSWLQRDMWLTPQGNLCYYSQKDQKRLVLIDGPTLYGSEITEVDNSKSARAYSFEIKWGEEKNEKFLLAATNAADLPNYIVLLKKVSSNNVLKTMKLGADTKKKMDAIRITIKNRRLALDKENIKFKAQLSKVKGQGSPLTEGDWFDRQFWITVTGKFAYYSQRDEKDLVYFNAEDIKNATLKVLTEADSVKPFSFSITLKQKDEEIIIEPAVFAAESDAKLKEWMAAFKAEGMTVA